MKTKTFLIFTLPSFIMMVFFIAIPLLTVVFQSFQFKQELLETREQEKCDPFGCETEIVTIPVLDDNGNTIKQNQWVGFQNYKNLLKFDEVQKAFSTIADNDKSFIISGTGDVLEPEEGIIGIGSGGNYALAAAKVLMDSKMSAEEIAKKSIQVASEICVYTNNNITLEKI